MSRASASRAASATLLILQLGTARADVSASAPASTSADDRPLMQVEDVAANPSVPPLENIAFVRATGSGCPADSTTSFYDDESMTLVVQFSEYAIDVSSAQRVGTRNCALELSVSHAQGLGHVVANVQYRGYANLPAGTSARLETSYLFGGRADAATPLRHELLALEQKPWAVVHQVGSTKSSDVDCATQRFLSVPTILTSFNGTPGLDAHVDVESIEISLVSAPEASTALCGSR